MNEENTTLEKVNHWIKNSVTLKLTTIIILVLLLLIPASMIKSIIHEREDLNEQSVREVSAKWAKDQLINGPVLTIPILYEIERKEGPEQYTRYLHILPDILTVNGNVEPKKLSLGIYEIVVYSSGLSFSGSYSFGKKIDREGLKAIQWDEAFLTLGISDLRGIEEEINLTWGGQQVSVQPGSKISDIIHSGVTVILPDLEPHHNGNIDFSFDLTLQGSKNLSFVPVGSTTEVNLKSNWPAPGFVGNFIPDNREVTDQGFSSQWKVLQLNRNFPQSWMGTLASGNLENEAFGVDLILPLDDYRKSMRSAKYAIMTIALTFLVFFLVEILNGRKIHPFQYTLVGLALCLFYVLLVSISEHSNFNLAYGISALAIISMITFYSLSVFRTKKLSLLLLAILTGIYGFLFVTLQLADYALLMGSIGLTIILAGTMFFTRNINWYRLHTSSE
ncbi:MAG: cell envelope integrity protein CreD [Cyclobacteriaceae bacterium]|nr:cell envelope integrity protein CreD [Cyclobacteriaceae bacterium]